MSHDLGLGRPGIWVCAHGALPDKLEPKKVQVTVQLSIVA